MKSMPRPKLNAQSTSILHLVEDLLSIAPPFPFIAFPRRRSESWPQMGEQTRSQVARAPRASSSAKTSATQFWCETAAEAGVKGGGGHRGGEPTEPRIVGRRRKLGLCNGARDAHFVAFLLFPLLKAFSSSFLFLHSFNLFSL